MNFNKIEEEYSDDEFDYSENDTALENSNDLSQVINEMKLIDKSATKYASKFSVVN